MVHEPKCQNVRHAGELIPGTWFVDADGGLFGVMLDDRTNEKRIVSIGDFCRPFIAAVPVRSFKVSHVLKTGTVLRISEPQRIGGNNESK